MAIKLAQLETEITVNDAQARAKITDFERAAKKLGSSGTLGQIVGDADTKFGSFSSAVGSATSFVGRLPIPTGLAATAIAGLGVAAVGAGVELFNLAKQGSDFGRNLGAFQVVTGMSAASVSTLAYVANLSGKELTDLQRPIISLNSLMSKAAAGSDAAATKLHRVGVTDFHSLDNALQQSTKYLGEMAAGHDKLSVATDVYTKKGAANMLAAMAKMPEGFDAAKEHARQLGVQLSQDDINAAKDFGREFGTLKYQVETGLAKLALAFAPKLTSAIHEVSDVLSRNQSSWHKWGLVASDAIGVVAGAVKGWAMMYEDLEKNHPYVWMAMFGGIGGMASAYNDSLNERTKNDYSVVHSKYDKPLKKAGGSGDDDTDDSDSGGGAGGSSRRIKVKSDLPAFGSMTKLVLSTGNPQWDAWFAEMGAKWHVDPNVLLLQAGAESTYNSGALSPKGAQGFSQMMPGTAARFGVNTSSVKDSIRGQAQYMGLLLSMFGGDYKKALAGYNAGEGNVQKYGGVPPFRETQNYVGKIQSSYLSRVRSKKDGNFGTYDPEAATQKDQDEATKKADEAIKARIDGFNRIAEIGRLTYDELIKDDERYYARAEESGDISGELKAANDIYSIKVARANDEVNLATKVVTQYKQGTAEREKADFDWSKALIKSLGDVKAAYYDLESVRRGLSTRMAQESLEMIQNAGTPDVKDDPSKDLGNGRVATGIAAVDAILRRAAAAKQETDAMKQLKASWKGLRDEMKASVGVQNIAISMGQMGIDMFRNMTQAVGEAVQGYVLYGSSIGQALRQALAAELAHVASLATVKAIQATALGFLLLAENDFPGAGHAFISAGLWASIAAGSAIAGRSVAPKQQGASSTGTSAPSQPTGPTSLGSNPALGNFTRSTNLPWLNSKDMQSRSNDRLSAAIETFNQKVEAAPPGHVFMKGMQANRGVIGEQLVKDLRSNHKIGEGLTRAVGLRRRG